MGQICPYLFPFRSGQIWADVVEDLSRSAPDGVGRDLGRSGRFSTQQPYDCGHGGPLCRESCARTPVQRTVHREPSIDPRTESRPALGSLGPEPVAGAAPLARQTSPHRTQNIGKVTSRIWQDRAQIFPTPPKCAVWL
eukprot:gene11126-biopygen6346